MACIIRCCATPPPKNRFCLDTKDRRNKSKSLVETAKVKDKQPRNELSKMIPNKHVACVERVYDIENERAKLIIEGHVQLIESLADSLFKSPVFESKKEGVTRKKMTFYGSEDGGKPQDETDDWKWSP